MLTLTSYPRQAFKSEALKARVGKPSIIIHFHHCMPLPPSIHSVGYYTEAQELNRRKGGGGGGGGGGGSGAGSISGRGGGSKPSSSNTTLTSPTPGVPILSLVPQTSLTVTFNNRRLYARSMGDGGSRKYSVLKGEPFTGRDVGGGNRSQVYGNSFVLCYFFLSVDANLSWATVACMGVDTQGLNLSVVSMDLGFHSCSILLSITPGQVQIISTERPR